MENKRIAILGLGIMGSGMAGRLLAANFPLAVYNRNAEKAAAFVSGGAVLAHTPREAGTRAEIIISMVADDIASRAIWLGANGALAGAAPGSVLIESSTLTVPWVKELAIAAAGRGCEFLDAPVTGSKSQAATGELTFLVGGSADALAIAKPALAAMSHAIVYLGPTGSGALLKLVNNFLCGVQAASLAEGLALMAKSGLDPAKAATVLTNGAPGSPLVKTLAARAAASDFTPHFLLRLMAKDLRYAAEEGNRKGVSLFTASAALEEFHRAEKAGFGEKDFSAVIEALRPR